MGNRISRPPQTSKGALLRSIDRKILELSVLQDEIERELDRVMKGLTPQTMTGTDYSAEKVVSGSKRVDFIATVRAMDGLRTNLDKTHGELLALKRKKEKIVKIYANNANNADVEAQIFYYREILGYTQHMTATKVGYSERQIQRIEKKMKS